MTFYLEINPILMKIEMKSNQNEFKSKSAIFDPNPDKIQPKSDTKIKML